MSWNFLCKSNATDLNFTVFNSYKQVKENDWNQVLQNRNIYLKLNYLSAIENSLQSELVMRYVLFYNKSNQPVGIAVVQILDFVDAGTKYYEMLCKVGNHIKDKILKSLKIKVMVCGNVFACGENGFLYSDDISPELAYENLSQALYQIRKSEQGISLLVLKEFWPQSFHKSDNLKSNSFREFKIDVNMVLKVHESWTSTDDYLASMTTKFRTKAKSVFKKSVDVHVKSMEVEELIHYKKELKELYSNVVRKSDFKFGELSEDSFIKIKENLGDDFYVRGYFLNEELIGFSAAFLSETYVDANYVGLNYDYNYEYALYQRMLYDFVELAISHKAKELRLGRTAEEIKSSIGAEPTEMKLYVRHKNSVSNKLLKPIIESISPSEFEIRRPFKVSFS